MIQEYIEDIAVQMGIRLSSVSVEEEWNTFCQDAYLVNLVSEGYQVDIVVYKPDLDNLKTGSCCDMLTERFKSALSRLQLLLAP
jgi:hypothetical protein